MINHIWSILCRRSVIDNETNNISLYDVLEELGIEVTVKGQAPQDLPINIPIDYEVVSMWMKDKKEIHEKGDIDIEIVNPQGKVLKNIPQAVEIASGSQRLRSRMRIAGFGATGSGIYLFRVKMKQGKEKEYKTVAELPLEVKITKKVEDQKVGAQA